jgi:hypothetical protein
MYKSAYTNLFLFLMSYKTITGIDPAAKEKNPIGVCMLRDIKIATLYLDDDMRALCYRCPAYAFY